MGVGKAQSSKDLHCHCRESWDIHMAGKVPGFQKEEEGEEKEEEPPVGVVAHSFNASTRQVRHR